MIDRIVLGRLEFERDGNEMFINRLDSDDPDSEGDHVATAEGIWDDVWESFVEAATKEAAS